MAKKPLPPDEVFVLELLMARYAAGQPIPLTVDEAWAYFCAGKCEFTSFYIGDEKHMGVAPVKGAAIFSAARRHKVKYKALLEARKLAELNPDE